MCVLIRYMKICLATENKGKVAEIQALLDGLPVTIVTSKDLGIEMDVAETGKTYRENAYLKASSLCSQDRSSKPGGQLRSRGGRTGWRSRAVFQPFRPGSKPDRPRSADVFTVGPCWTNPDPGPPSLPARSVFAIPMAGTGFSMAGAMARSFRRNAGPMVLGMTRSFKWPG